MMSYGSLMWLTVACSPPGNSIWDIPWSPILPFYHPLSSFHRLFLSESIRFQTCICQTFELAQVSVRAVVVVCSLIPGTILTRLILNLCVCVGRGAFLTFAYGRGILVHLQGRLVADLAVTFLQQQQLLWLRSWTNPSPHRAPEWALPSVPCLPP